MYPKNTAFSVISDTNYVRIMHRNERNKVFLYLSSVLTYSYLFTVSCTPAVPYNLNKLRS